MATTLAEEAAVASEHGRACSGSGASEGDGADDALNDVECYAEPRTESPSEPRAETGGPQDGAAASSNGVQSWHAGAVPRAPMPSPAGVPGQTVKMANDASGPTSGGAGGGASGGASGVAGKRIKIPGSLRCQVAEAVREFQMIGHGDKVRWRWRHARDTIETRQRH